MLIQFVEDVTVRDNSGRHYPKGCVVEMAADACRHFVVRKKAVFCSAPKKVESPAVEDPVVEAVEESTEAVEVPAPKKSKKRRK